MRTSREIVVEAVVKNRDITGTARAKRDVRTPRQVGLSPARD
jgi:hypothetical protein